MIYKRLTGSEELGTVLGRCTVERHIECDDRQAQPHCLHQGRVGSTCTVTVNINSGIAAQRAQFITVVDGVQQVEVLCA